MRHCGHLRHIARICVTLRTFVIMLRAFALRAHLRHCAHLRHGDGSQVFLGAAVVDFSGSGFPYLA